MSAGVHEEVFGALIYSALQIPGAEVDFYRNHGFRYGFGDILSTFYNKPVKRLDALYHDLSVDEDGSRIDIVISTTCALHLSAAGQRMMDAYEAREKKFKLFCVIHDSFEIESMEKDLRPWALNGSLSFITLSLQYGFYLLSPPSNSFDVVLKYGQDNRTKCRLAYGSTQRYLRRSLR